MPTIRTYILIAGFAFGLTWTSSAVETDPTVPSEIEYNRDIRPILSDACFTCHGPDANHIESGLRLDQRESAIGAADSGEHAIVPGDPKASELIRRILASDSSLKMPPEDSGKSLSESQMRVLQRWIEQGAEYEGHWAFSPVTRPELPSIDASDLLHDWPQNPVDQFVLEKLLRAGLKPAPEAPRETLIRRLSLDLRGEAPTVDEVHQFLTNPDPNAYEQLVDQFLESPRYGERMALNWLDYARYADSNGFQSDGSRDLWAWRDWVIHAYNQNMPFDQFTVEQLAGDMLPDATRDQIIATGFNRNHRLNGEGGRIVEEWFVETVIDRVETTGLTWLGLTLNCCRCHDHKFDPISQKEFYQLFAFFNSVDESGVLSPQGKNGENTPPLMSLRTAADEAKIADWEAKIAQQDAELKELKEQLTVLANTWAEQLPESLRSAQSTWTLAAVHSIASKGGAKFEQLPNRSWLATGPNPANDTYSIRFDCDSATISAIMVEVHPHASLPNASLGRGFNGNFVLTDVSAQLIAPDSPTPIPLKLDSALASYEQKGWQAASLILPAKPGQNKGWAVDGNALDKRIARKLVLILDKPMQTPQGSQVELKLKHNSQYSDHNIGNLSVFYSQGSKQQLGFEADLIPENVLAAVQIPRDQRQESQSAAIADYYLSNIPNPIQDAQVELEKSKKELQDFVENLPVTMVMREAKEPRQAFLLSRGEYDRPNSPVERGVPAMLPGLPPGASVDRLGLARWIASRENPLTARVWVNREWERFFGTGIVKTTENFGSQAEYPSHPQLLDWLAAEFMSPTQLPSVGHHTAQPWDMKALQKLLVMSATYRQSSTPDQEMSAMLRERDPTNRLLSHAARFRLPGELIRDQALQVSGLLVEKTGGPSVRPYMPDGVWDETSKYGNLRNYRRDQGEGLYRRSIYTIWKRTAAPPSMLLFDAPNREVCTIKRSRTNTPLQALSLLNEVTFVEAARKLAERMLTEVDASDNERLIFAFQLLVARQPTDEELQILTRGLAEDRARFKQNPEAARQLIAFGDSKSNLPVPAEELAAWTLTANVLLNLDEFITRP